jgi:hypothetical protein
MKIYKTIEEVNTAIKKAGGMLEKCPVGYIIVSGEDVDIAGHHVRIYVSEFHEAIIKIKKDAYNEGFNDANVRMRSCVEKRGSQFQHK